MAERKNRNAEAYSYVGDNLARRPEPARRAVTREEIQIRRNRERSRSMSFGYVAAMAVVVGITLGICLNYLSVQNSVNSRLRHIAQLEDEYDDLLKENEALELSINAYEDYAYIYDVATKELGMRPATSDQIIPFDLEESEYVKQNEGIPEE